jgi:hypothetical protein
MSHLLPRERWEVPVGHLAYLCGTLDDGDTPSLPTDAVTDRPRLLAASERWLTEDAAALWPRAAPGGRFDWNVLVAPGDATGPARLASQYIRVNTDPAERYVLSAPGTTKLRLFPDESGFDNVVLAGDWTRTGLDVGCIEAAVMSGKLAARAISGHPAVVIGEAPRPGASTNAPRAVTKDATKTTAAVARRDPPPSDLPAYVERGSDPTQRPPYRLDRCQLTAFGLSADRDRLGALVDRDLNGPAAGVVRYTPAAPLVVLIAAFSGRAASTDAEHATRGWIPEADVAFWVPLLRRGGGPPGLVWYMPYVWVDSVAPMVSGREIYGFSKSLADMDVAHGPCGLERLALRAPVLERYAPTTTTTDRTFLSVTRTGGGGGTTLPDFLRRNLPSGPTTFVFLKQLRDVAAPDRACYQAVVEAQSVPRTVRAAGLAEGVYQVTLTRYDSHPFVRELGLAERREVEPRLSPMFAAYADFDFTMEAGRVVAGGAR